MLCSEILFSITQSVTISIWVLVCHDSAYRQRLTDMVLVYTKMKNHVHVSNMYIYFCKSMYTYVHGMYMVCTKGAINVYVHGSNMYVHVYRFMSVFELYIHVHTMYKRVHAVFCSSC